VRDIAVLLDGQQQPAMLVTFDPQQNALLVQRLNEVKEGRQDSMQLWALTADAPPRSLGVIESKYKTLQMPVTADALRGVTQLAISVENKDSTTAVFSPALPYLFQGWLVQKSI
jgi:anti-sigma-K factor RskA